MIFPQFRKHQSGKNFYTLHSLTDFEEIQIMGQKTLRHTLQAKTYFEKVQIQDMIACHPPYLLCTEDEMQKHLKG